jgi:uncharacterized protein YprB with RNaseH-like and TPR domain
MGIIEDTINKVRCKDRHTVEEHPACFAVGSVVDNRKDKSIPWYQTPGLQIGYLDIESDGLFADFDTMLTWCLKLKDGPVAHSIVKRKELFSGSPDKRLVADLIEEMKKYKIIVTYYGSRFDIPFVRAKALHYGLDFPRFSDIYSFDLYYSVRAKLKLSRRSLDSACNYLGIEGKTPIDKEVWRQAKYGDSVALKSVLEHNIGDVAITEKLHNKLEPFSKWSRTSI